LVRVPQLPSAEIRRLVLGLPLSFGKFCFGRFPLSIFDSGNHSWFFEMPQPPPTMIPNPFGSLPLTFGSLRVPQMMFSPVPLFWLPRTPVSPPPPFVWHTVPRKDYPTKLRVVAWRSPFFAAGVFVSTLPLSLIYSCGILLCVTVPHKSEVFFHYTSSPSSKPRLEYPRTRSVSHSLRDSSPQGFLAAELPEPFPGNVVSLNWNTKQTNMFPSPFDPLHSSPFLSRAPSPPLPRKKPVGNLFIHCYCFSALDVPFSSRTQSAIFFPCLL